MMEWTIKTLDDDRQIYRATAPLGHQARIHNWNDGRVDWSVTSLDGERELAGGRLNSVSLAKVEVEQFVKKLR